LRLEVSQVYQRLNVVPDLSLYFEAPQRLWYLDEEQEWSYEYAFDGGNREILDPLSYSHPDREVVWVSLDGYGEGSIRCQKRAEYAAFLRLHHRAERMIGPLGLITFLLEVLFKFIAKFLWVYVFVLIFPDR